MSTTAERGEGGSGETLVLSDEELGRSRSVSSPEAGGVFRINLVVVARDGARVLPLAEGAPVVVGRDAPADVVVRDGSLSRRHAAVELRGGTLWVEDLGSTNGTRVNGERVERARVGPADELSFGAVPAFVQAIDPSGPRARGVLSHDRFLEELEAEAARARAFGRGFALVLARVDPAAVARWLPAAQGLLRPFDRLALYGPGTVEALLPEAGEDAARALAERLRAGHGAAPCGVGAFPAHAAGAEELLEVTLAALRRATGDGAVAVAAPVAGRPPRGPGGAGEPVSASAAMANLLALARRVAASTIPVLVVGETGTGKEVVARAIHEGSPRRGGRMICVNCGALPAQLVESTLFGHERGAFTGASQRAPGVFEAADGGTVLLDEVGELPAAAQAALLRVLETRRFCRVGSPAEVEVDVRVVAATHRDLAAMCEAGAFRRDLLYRLNAMVIEIPPLRSRPDDVEPLARRFVAEAAAAQGRGEVRDIAAAALAALLAYPWPGNVRELRNAIERAVVIAEGPAIGLDDLPGPVAAMARATWRADAPARPLAPAAAPPGPAAEVDAGAGDLRGELDRIEREMIRRALDRSGGDRTEAARLLGLPPRTLSDKLRKHGLR